MPKQGLPTQALILALVAVLIVPAVIFVGVVLDRYADTQRAQYEQEALEVAQAVASIIDRDMNGMMGMVLSLSTSEHPRKGDFEAFYKQARLVNELTGANFVLRRPDGQQLVNTRRPWGSPLPVSPVPGDESVIATKRAIVSNVFNGVVAGEPLVAVTAPILKGDEVIYLLNMSISTTIIANSVMKVTPPQWIVGVGDQIGTMVARSVAHQDYTGKPGLQSFIEMAAKKSGNLIARNFDGEPAVVGYTWLESPRWLIAANMPQSVVERPLQRALWLWAGSGVAILIATSLIALWLWRFIARPLDALASASRQFGDPDAQFRIRTPLREFAAVSATLAAAADRVRSHNAALETAVAERTRELAQANKSLTAQMTAREAAEGQIRQMQKMEAIGQLTGGIAHDFNNMLSIIVSALGLLQRRLDRGDTHVEKYSNAALEAAERAASLTRRLLAFSRQQPLAPEPLDLNQLIGGMSEMMQRTLGEAVRIETRLGDGLWHVHADASQVENALLNLAVNARDAMDHNGQLTIVTANTAIDEDYASAHDGLTPGDYVRITVRDTGMGMTPDVIERAFDPFFTTKAVGMGTGLGLSQVYGFLKQSSGHIKIETEPGRGTSITMYLPRYIGADFEPIKAVTRSHPLLSVAAGEIILVVEDEDRLRQISVDALTDFGYTALEASHGRDALAMLEKNPAIALLFTDIVMPDINGDVLAREAIAKRPALKVLFTTGFSRDAVIHDGVLAAGVNVLPKPFTTEQLAEKVRQVLSGTPTDIEPVGSKPADLR